MEKCTGPNGPAAEEREQALAREIRVKDALIHEVHHRVKNNLQTVESLDAPAYSPLPLRRGKKRPGRSGGTPSLHGDSA